MICLYEDKVVLKSIKRCLFNVYSLQLEIDLSRSSSNNPEAQKVGKIDND
jgi:hypothetical protein